MFRSMYTRFGPVFAAALIFTATSANATLIGDSVQAVMSVSSTLSIVTQFPSPAVVGGGIEFTGGISITGGSTTLTANIEVDVGDAGFTVTGLSTNWGSHSEPNALRIDLTDLDWVGQTGQIIGMNDLGGGHNLQSFGFGSNSAFVVFSRINFISNNNRTFSFDVYMSPNPRLSPSSASASRVSALRGAGGLPETSPTTFKDTAVFWSRRFLLCGMAGIFKPGIHGQRQEHLFLRVKRTSAGGKRTWRYRQISVDCRGPTASPSYRLRCST